MNKIIKTVKKENTLFDSSALQRANANIEAYSPEELAHFGVRGMKWGVRKDASANTKVRRDRAKMHKNRRTMSDSDLKRAVNRIQMEKKLKTLVEQDLAPGKLAVRDFLSKTGTAGAAAAAGVAGAALMKKYLASRGIGGG